MIYKKLPLTIIAVFLFLIVSAQDKKPGVITGTVKDAHSKSPLNEAVITLSSNAFTGQKFAITDSTGKYTINNLPAGHYKIMFEMEGYETFSQDSIVLNNGTLLGVTFEMEKEGKKKQAERTVKNAITTIVLTN